MPLSLPPLVTPAELLDHAPGQIWVDGIGPGWDDVTLRGYRYDSRPRVTPVRLRQHALVLYLRGHATITRRKLEGDLHEEQAEVAPGDVSVQDSSWNGAWSWRGALDVLHLYVEPAFLQRVAASPSGQLRDSLKVRDDTISQIGAQLVAEVGSGLPGSRLLVRALSEQLAVHLVRNYLADTQVESEPRGLAGHRVARLHALMERELAGDLSLAKLAKTAGLGTHQLTRLFRVSFGTTPHCYVMELRLSRARALLLESQAPISDISASTGFADQSHLTRAFTRRFGTSPSRFRADARRGT